MLDRCRYGLKFGLNRSQTRWFLPRKVYDKTHTLKDNGRIYPLTVADQHQHIAQSEHLLATIQPNDPATLYWSLAEPAGLVLGFSQKPAVLNQATLAQHPFPIYQRRAGGTAVLVGPSLLSLDVVLPAGHPLILADVVESYCWFGEAWVAALRLLGIETRAISPTEAHTQRALLKQPETRSYELLMNRACYGTVSPYEVVVGFNPVPISRPQGNHKGQDRSNKPSPGHPQGMPLQWYECAWEADSYHCRGIPCGCPAVDGEAYLNGTVVGLRKVGGLDMIRRRAGSLLQAGVLLHWESDLLAQLLGHSAEEQELLRTGLQQRAVGLDTLAGREVGINEVISAFEKVIVAIDNKVDVLDA